MRGICHSYMEAYAKKLHLSVCLPHSNGPLTNGRHGLPPLPSELPIAASKKNLNFNYVRVLVRVNNCKLAI